MRAVQRVAFMFRSPPKIITLLERTLAKSWEVLPAQPVDATPSAINRLSKGGVHDARKTGEALRDAEERDVGSPTNSRIYAVSDWPADFPIESLSREVYAAEV